MAVCHGGIFNGDVVDGGAFVAHGSRVNHAVQCLVKGGVTHAPGSAHADKGICTAFNQLFQRNGGRRAAHAGGRDRHRHAVQLAHPGFVLAVVSNQLRLVKIGSDQIGAEGVTRQQHIAADIPLP